MIEGPIRRDPAAASRQTYDVIVVGGGVQGIMIALEAARRGLRPLLLERGDFGGATSWSSLRIIHGGLRYLQSMNLRRFAESVAERRWFLRHFPDLVRPLPCLMPLYGRGVKSPAVMRLALLANDVLSATRNVGVDPTARLPTGRLIDAAGVERRFPQVSRPGLRGGALWHDAVMLSSERVLIELLRWACASGAVVLNYVEVERLLVEQERVCGVAACDHLTGRKICLRGSHVINATGPWVRRTAARLDRDLPALFRPTLAFNLLLERDPIAEVAVAVTPPGGQTYFVLPWKGRVLAGTPYAAVPEDTVDAAPTREHLGRFLADLNRALPGLQFTERDIIQVYAGLLPGRPDGTAEPLTRPKLHHHCAHGGPDGLFSVVGVKFTTARRLAEQTLVALFGRSGTVPSHAATPRPRAALDFTTTSLSRPFVPSAAAGDAIERLTATLAEEAVTCPDDLLLRRLDSAELPIDRTGLRATLAQRLPARATGREDAGTRPPGET